MRLVLPILAAAFLCGCSSMNSSSGPLMKASWGNVMMSTGSTGTLVWVPTREGLVLRLPWMRYGRVVETRDGADKSSVYALMRFSKADCDKQDALVMIDETAASAEAVGGCGAPIRLSEAEGYPVVVDDSTMAVYRINGTELVTMRAALKTMSTSQKAQAVPTAKPVPGKVDTIVPSIPAAKSASNKPVTGLPTTDKTTGKPVVK